MSATRVSPPPGPARSRIRLPGIAALLAAAAVFLPGDVGGQESPDGPLRIEARVSPSPVPFGDPVAFRLSLTNTGKRSLSVRLATCPVRIRVDGDYSPAGPCDRPERTLDLDPGQSVTLGPEEAPLLALEPRVYPLAPGSHRVVLAAPGVGAADTTFEVLPPEPGGGALGGRWLASDGEPTAGGLVFLSRGIPRDPEADDLRGPDVARSRTSDAGGFLFTDLEPGTYLLRAVAGGRTLWYPGVRNPLLARPLAVDDGAYRAVSLENEPSETRAVEGSVFELSPAPAAHPLAGAVVVAIPSWPRLPGSGEPGYPTAVTDPDGRFRLDLSEGFYRLVAGKLATHRYQYWNHVASGRVGAWIRVPEVTDAPGASAGTPETIRFDLEPLRDAEVAVIRGQVLGQDPRRTEPPTPLADAEVSAVPLVPAEDASAAPHRIRTGSDGTFRLEVPADTPYWVEAAAAGWRPATYRNAGGRRGATRVDVAPGESRDGVDFLLAPGGGPADNAPDGTATIQGTVFRPLPAEGLDPASCLTPAPGVRVRVVPVYPSVSPLEFRTVTDAEGRYRLEGLPARNGGGPAYRILAGDNPGPLLGLAGALFEARSGVVAVRPGQTVTAERLVLAGPQTSEERGTVRGWVLDPAGAPIAGAEVAVYADPENPEGAVVRAGTNAEGAFAATGLPLEADVVVAARADGYVPAYHPGVRRWRDSKRVTASADPETGIRLVLGPAPGGDACVQTGRVLRPVLPTAGSGPERGPVAGAFTYLEPVGGGAERPTAGGVTGINGTVIVTGIAPGRYRMVADRPGFEPGVLETPSGEALDLALEPTASSAPVEITLAPVGAEPVESRDAGEVHPVLTALGNAPNPFRPRTAIRYRLSETGTVSAYVFDYRGRLIRTLLENEEQPPGVREVVWDGRDEDGNRVSAGVYFYRLQAAGYAVSSKMVVLP